MSSRLSRTTTFSAHVFLDHGWARQTEKEVTAGLLTSYRPKITTKTVESEPTLAWRWRRGRQRRPGRQLAPT